MIKEELKLAQNLVNDQVSLAKAAWYIPSKNYSQHALHTKRGMGKCENISRRYDELLQKTNSDAPQTYQQRTSHKRR